jgi:hypothetical protein
MTELRSSRDRDSTAVMFWVASIGNQHVPKLMGNTSDTRGVMHSGVRSAVKLPQMATRLALKQRPIRRRGGEEEERFAHALYVTGEFVKEPMLVLPGLNSQINGRENFSTAAPTI